MDPVGSVIQYFLKVLLKNIIKNIIKTLFSVVQIDLWYVLIFLFFNMNLNNNFLEPTEKLIMT